MDLCSFSSKGAASCQTGVVTWARGPRAMATIAGLARKLDNLAEQIVHLHSMRTEVDDRMKELVRVRYVKMRTELDVTLARMQSLNQQADDHASKIEELERRITLWQQDKESLRLMSIQLQSQMNNMRSTITNIQATARHNSNDLRNLVVRR